MRLSQYPINTVKETPAEAELISHQLMLRAGLIRRLAAGIYNWLPLGLRTLRKVETIVRQEMNRAGALELLMSAVQPAELWQESGRWKDYGPELLRLKDRHQRDFVIGPTHEEVITDIARREHQELPAAAGQTSIRSRSSSATRSGRASASCAAREFIMKDAYSFHVDEASLAQGYAAMRTAYTRMFERMGLDFRVVQADTGAIGGSASEEFQVLAASGEDAIAVSDGDDVRSQRRAGGGVAAGHPARRTVRAADQGGHARSPHHRRAERAAGDSRRRSASRRCSWPAARARRWR